MSVNELTLVEGDDLSTLLHLAAQVELWRMVQDITSITLREIDDLVVEDKTSHKLRFSRLMATGLHGVAPPVPASKCSNRFRRLPQGAGLG